MMQKKNVQQSDTVLSTPYNMHKQRTDKLILIDVTNKCVDHKENHKRNCSESCLFLIVETDLLIQLNCS